MRSDARRERRFFKIFWKRTSKPSSKLVPSALRGGQLRRSRSQGTLRSGCHAKPNQDAPPLRIIHYHSFSVHAEAVERKGVCRGPLLPCETEYFMFTSFLVFFYFQTLTVENWWQLINIWFSNWWRGLFLRSIFDRFGFQNILTRVNRIEWAAADLKGMDILTYPSRGVQRRHQKISHSTHPGRHFSEISGTPISQNWVFEWNFPPKTSGNVP